MLSPSIPVRVTVTELPGGNPLQTYEELLRDRPGHDVFLFESPAGPVQDRRWAAVGWDRLAEIRLYAGRVELTAEAALGDLLAESVSAEAGPPKEAYDGIRVWDVSAPEARWRLLSAITEAFDVDTDLGQDTFAFGFLTVLSYEAAWDIEDIPQTQQGTDMPRCTLALFRNTVWYDQHSGGVRLLSASGPHFPAQKSEQALTPAAASGESEPSIIPAAPAPRSVTDNVEQETFTGRVERCLRHIGVGDSYQIQIGPPDRRRDRSDPARGLPPAAPPQSVPVHVPDALDRPDRDRRQPRAVPPDRGPHASHAPDRRHRAARPPTRPRTTRRVAELRASAKEQAEHVMLVDLCRNDIGRVCVPGTLQVDDHDGRRALRLRPPPGLHVSGDLEDGAEVWDADPRDLPGRHHDRRAEGARHGDHRRARGRPARRSTPARSA